MADLRPCSPLAHRRVAGRPATTSNAGLTVREVEDLGVLLMTADLDRHPHLRVVVEGVLAGPLGSPDRPGAGALMAIWQSPSDWLLTGPAAAAAGMMSGFSRALDREPALVTDASEGHIALELSGPAARMICPLPPLSDYRGLHSAVGRFAGLRVTMLFEPAGSVRLFVEAADADYLWTWLADRLPALNSVTF